MVRTQPGQTFTDICERFFDFEESKDLFELKIENVFFWERVRFSIHRMIVRELGLSDLVQSFNQHGLTSIARRVCSSLGGLVRHSPISRISSEIAFFGTGRRKKNSAGKWEDIYIDPLLPKLERPFVFFEPRFQGRHWTPAETSRILHTDLLDLSAAVLRSTRLVHARLSHLEREQLRSIEKSLLDEFGVEVGVSKCVRASLTERKSALSFYTALLGRIRPRLVFLVCSYGRETLVEACKGLGIPVVEIQHGVLGRYHLGYSYPSSAATKRAFPDYMLLFGEYWKKAVDFPLAEDRVRILGYPHFEAERSRVAGLHRRRQILFVSQPVFGERLSRFASELQLLKGATIKIVYKLHPRERRSWESRYPWLKKAGIHIVDDDSPTLYELFATSTAQVGVNSTALFEGLGYGLQTFIVKAPGYEYMGDLLRQGHATLVENAEDVLDVAHLPTNRHVSIDEFFAPNAMARFESILDELLHEAG